MMSEQSPNILNELENVVGLCVNKYKKTNDVEYINLASDELKKVLVDIENTPNIASHKLQAPIRGMLAGLNHIIEMSENDNE